MAMVCTRVTEWIRQDISKPVEDWEESLHNKCKKRKVYDPRGWFCWLIRVPALVIRWAIVTVVTMVVTIVCDVLIRPATDRIQTFRLRRHVREEIDKRFADQPELAEAIAQLIIRRVERRLDRPSTRGGPESSRLLQPRS